MVKHREGVDEEGESVEGKYEDEGGKLENVGERDGGGGDGEGEHENREMKKGKI